MPRLAHSSIEPLEARIAPAAVVTFPDTDGDTVKVTATKGSMADLTAAIHHNNGGQLDLIDLSAPVFAGTGLTVTISALGAHGNGVVDIGYINAGTNALGAVLIKGDLAKITGTNVASLTINSLGERGTLTGAADNVSTLTGNLGPLKIFGNIEESSLAVGGKLTSATIGGNLDGGNAANSGTLSVAGPAGAIKIGGDLQGGGGDSSGALLLSATEKSGAVTVNGQIVGGGGPSSGTISGKTLASLFVGGSITGGSMVKAGSVTVTNVGNLTVDGDLFGGSDMQTGYVSIGSSGGLVVFGGSIYGNSGPQSGYFGAGGVIKGVTVHGSIQGGTALTSGAVDVREAAMVLIAGSVSGGSTMNNAGSVNVSGTSNSITIGGSLIGGSSPNSGSLKFLYTKALKIGGSVSGDLTLNSGSIFGVDVGSVEIGGDVTNANVAFGSDVTPRTIIQVASSVHIGGSVLGSFLNFGRETRSDISVGTVQVDGDWTTSNLLVGAVNYGADKGPGGNGANADNVDFGNLNDDFALALGNGAIDPSIKSIVIEGAIRGDASAAHYGFVSGKIGSFRAGSVNVPLAAGASNDLRSLGANVAIHEIDGTVAAPNPTLPALKGAALTFTDTDGDLVKVTSSKGTKAHLTTAVQVSVAGQLQKIDLAQFGTEFAGANLTVAVVQLGAGGDGVVNVGAIDATGLALGAVLVKGDLGKLTAGSADTKPGVASLTVDSLGQFGTATGAADLITKVTGNLGPVKIFGNLDEAEIDVTGKLTSATIGGNVIGGTAGKSGSLNVGGVAGAVKLGGNLFGGDGMSAGTINLSGATAGAITIGGSVEGGGGGQSGTIQAGKAASLAIGGAILGGSVANSGALTLLQVGNVTIGGEVHGSQNLASTGVLSVTGTSGVVKIGGNVRGSGVSSGEVVLLGVNKSLSVGGSIAGGGATESGTLHLGDSGSVTIGGSIFGNNATAAGSIGGIYGNKLAKVTINGALQSGTGVTGLLRVVSSSAVKILGTVNGASTLAHGDIVATASLGTFDISGSLIRSSLFIGGVDSKAGSSVTASAHVGGEVSSSTFAFGGLARADVKVGTVTVDGIWRASNLLVGAVNLGTDDAVGGAAAATDNVNFGDTHDARAATSASATAISSIASIIIEGAISGTGGGTDHFGFVAGQISAFRAGAVKLALMPKGGNDSIEAGSTSDVTIKELPLPH